MTAEKQVHNIAPLYDEKSQILILGSFPSVKSREAAFFYAHPQNRFWRVMAYVLGCPVPVSVEEKKAMLHGGHVALWDTIASCTITGSSDASIRDAVPNDLNEILKAAPIRLIFTNGGTSHRVYRKYQYRQLGRADICLPSTSPANARCSLDALKDTWSRELWPFLGGKGADRDE